MPEMQLKLTNVGGLTVDTTAARIRQGAVAVTTDGATALGLGGLGPGTRVRDGGRTLARARAHRIATVQLAAGTTTLSISRR
jgi:malic enzyme